MSMYDAVNQIGTIHTNLSGRYGCRAYMTVVTFVFSGVVHRARRFFRADMTGTGKVELYTVEPYPGEDRTSSTEFGWYESTTSEDFLGYAAANPQSRRDRLAVELLDSAVTGDSLGADTRERVAQMEMV
jgi:hypothetical protein